VVYTGELFTNTNNYSTNFVIVSRDVCCDKEKLSYEKSIIVENYHDTAPVSLSGIRAVRVLVSCNSVLWPYLEVGIGFTDDIL
jgi:hypothetical protein